MISRAEANEWRIELKRFPDFRALYRVILWYNVGSPRGSIYTQFIGTPRWDSADPHYPLPTDILECMRVGVHFALTWPPLVSVEFGFLNSNT